MRSKYRIIFVAVVLVLMIFGCGKTSEQTRGASASEIDYINYQISEGEKYMGYLDDYAYLWDKVGTDPMLLFDDAWITDIVVAMLGMEDSTFNMFNEPSPSPRFDWIHLLYGKMYREQVAMNDDTVCAIDYLDDGCMDDAIGHAENIADLLDDISEEIDRLE